MADVDSSMVARRRRAEALAMRRSGMKLREVAETFGVSQSRAGQLVRGALRDETYKHAPSAPVEVSITAASKIDDLPWSLRTYAVLKNCGFDSVADLLRADRATFQQEMLRVPNCNRRCWEEIASVLDHIESNRMILWRCQRLEI